MTHTPQEFAPGDVRLATPLLVRSGFGWVVSANEHAVWWRRFDGTSVRVAVRPPGAPPWEPWRIIPSPAGGMVDLDSVVALPTAVYNRSSSGIYGNGTSALVRRHGRLQQISPPNPSLPVTARAGDRRPFPDQNGWVWVDGDTAYRRRTDGHTEAFVRIPGRIGAWDVGPCGAFWCTDGNGLWAAAAQNLGHRVSGAVLERLALDLWALEPGDFVFDDEGTAMALAEAPNTREICLTGAPRLGRQLDEIVGLSPAPLPFPEPPQAACVTYGEGCVVRISAGSIEVWRTSGPPIVVPLTLPDQPLAIAGPHQGIVTVLTSAGVHGLTLDGRLAPTTPSRLHDASCSTHISSTDAGEVWWTDDGMVVPLYLANDLTRR